MAGDRDGAPHDLAFLIVVGAIAGRTEPADRLAVGFDESDVHPIIGGAAHQTDRNSARHRGVLGFNPALDLLHHRPQTGD